MVLLTVLFLHAITDLSRQMPPKPCFFLCFPGQNDESTFRLHLLYLLNVDCHIDQIFQLLLSLIQLAFPSALVLINGGPILRRLSLALVDQLRYGKLRTNAGYLN